VALGRGWLLSQSYSLLADYDDYRWNLDRDDRFYRQFVSDFRLAWDESPSLTGVSDIFWQGMYGIEPASPMRFEAGYTYTTSEGGDWQGDYYEISTQQERHEAGLLVGQSGVLSWSCEVRLTWDMSRELRLPMQLTWRTGKVSLQASAQPSGDVERLSAGCVKALDLWYPRLVRDFDWQAGLSVQASF